MAIYFLTSSQKKVDEASMIIPELKRYDIDLPEIQEMDPQAVIRHKLGYASTNVNGAMVVEDTGLYLSGLNGLPGPLVKWFIERIGSKGVADLAEQSGSMQAIAKTVIGFQSATGIQQYFTGEVKGQIVQPRGDNGFGWDPIFLPDGEEKTFAQMSLEEKNRISARRLAFTQLKAYLASV